MKANQILDGFGGSGGRVVGNYSKAITKGNNFVVNLQGGLTPDINCLNGATGTYYEVVTDNLLINNNNSFWTNNSPTILASGLNLTSIYISNASLLSCPNSSNLSIVCYWTISLVTLQGNAMISPFNSPSGVNVFHLNCTYLRIQQAA